MIEELRGKVVVFATSALDDLQTDSRYKGKAEELLRGLEERTGGRITVEYRCDRKPSDALDPKELDGAVGIVADMERYDRRVLSNLGPDFHIVARYGVGYDKIDLDAATENGIMATNAPGCNSMPTAEWTMTFIGAVAGRLPLNHEAASLAEPKDARGRRDISGSTIGIVGTGGIGSRVAKLLLAYDNVKILAKDPYPNEELAEDPRVEYVSNDEEGLYAICRHSNIITLHASVSDDKKPVITRDMIGSMKPGAFLVNCARYDLVDHEAAWESVRANADDPNSGMWGYGVDDPWMDFKTEEALCAQFPIDDINMVFGPHIGSDSPVGKIGMQMMSAMAIEDLFVYGRVPYNVVNKGVLTNSRFEGLDEVNPRKYQIDFAEKAKAD